MRKHFIFILALMVSFSGLAQHSEDEHPAEQEEKSAFNAAEHALHHAKDAHEIHFTDGFVIPLPVILWTDNGLVTFMSSDFHHSDDGSHVVSKKGMNFVKIHETIYQLEDGAKHAQLNGAHIENGAKVWLDFSLTKNVITIFFIAILLLLMGVRSAKKYKTEEHKAPSGIAGWTEPVILFVRDVARDNIEGEKYKKFTPYLLTVFFFILIGNLLGLIPFLTNPNVTGSISITILLAMFTFGIQMANSKKSYWLHIFDPLGDTMPWGGKILLYLILVPIEILGIFIKPAALLIRLFANITAGHIIVVSLISIIFVNESLGWAGLSVPFTLFISTLEILVAFLQAYIFMMLSALFIGMAVQTAHD